MTFLCFRGESIISVMATEDLESICTPCLVDQKQRTSASSYILRLMIGHLSQHFSSICFFSHASCNFPFLHLSTLPFTELFLLPLPVKATSGIFFHPTLCFFLPGSPFYGFHQCASISHTEPNEINGKIPISFSRLRIRLIAPSPLRLTQTLFRQWQFQPIKDCRIQPRVLNSCARELLFRRTSLKQL